MNEFSKLLHYAPSDQESEYATDREELVQDDAISETDRARIQIVIQHIEITAFREDIATAIDQYRELTLSNPTKQRQQDLNTLESIISDAQVYNTKEACIIAIREQLDKLKTGWFIFKGKSRLRNIIESVIAIHSSAQLKASREVLRREMAAHLQLKKKYRFIRGEEIEQLKLGLQAAQNEIEFLRQANQPLPKSSHSQQLEAVTPSNSLFDRFSSVFTRK